MSDEQDAVDAQDELEARAFTEWARRGVEERRAARRAAAAARPHVDADLHMEDDKGLNVARLPTELTLRPGDVITAGRSGFSSTAVVQRVEPGDDGKGRVYFRQTHLLQPFDIGLDRPILAARLTWARVTGLAESDLIHWEHDRHPVIGEHVLVGDGGPLLDAEITAVEDDGTIKLSLLTSAGWLDTPQGDT